MLYNYAALLIFIAFAVFIPTSFVLTSRLLSRREEGNKVKGSPYESGEETTGTSRDIDNEYLPYFMIFLPFEVILIVLLLWSAASKSFSYWGSAAVIMLGITATALSFVGYRLVSG